MYLVYISTLHNPKTCFRIHNLKYILDLKVYFKFINYVIRNPLIDYTIWKYILNYILYNTKHIFRLYNLETYFIHILLLDYII